MEQRDLNGREARTRLSGYLPPAGAPVWRWLGTPLAAAAVVAAMVPLPAFGVVDGDSARGLAVDAALGGCGVGGNEIVCEIDVAFAGAQGADHYTASVTRADGSVHDAGTVGTGAGGGSASIYVPYVGSGTYTVTVSAWGTDEEGGNEPNLLDRVGAGAGEDRDRGRASAEPADPEAANAGSEDAAPRDEATEAPSAESKEPAPEAQSIPECPPDAAAAAAAEPAEADQPPNTRPCSAQRRGTLSGSNSSP